MIYDYIIIGSGISGCICAYELGRRGKSCLILEKEAGPHEKICGGGISFKAIELLKSIDIDVLELIDDRVSVIKGHTIHKETEIKHKEYRPGTYSLGMPRYLFDLFLLEKALQVGARIKYNEEVYEVHMDNNIYVVNSYKSFRVVWAIGARGIKGTVPKGQSMGISAQITGTSNLAADKFYYWYYTHGDDKYFWVFPIGKDLWNIGVWFRHPENIMKKDFDEGIERYVKPNFTSGFEYKYLPKGEFLGNIDQRNLCILYKNGIGDFAGRNNSKNGGGIIGAIQSAIEYTLIESRKWVSVKYPWT